LEVGRDDGLPRLIKEAMAPYADVSGVHLRLSVHDGALHAQHLSQNSVTFIVSRRGGNIHEEHLPPGETDLASGTVLRLGDHAYIQVNKEED
jgi:hypothetical protein